MADAARLCPFFGKHAVRLNAPAAGWLIRTGGNQCALVTTSYRPCYLQLTGHAPELEACEWKGSHRAEEFVQFTTVNISEPREEPPR